MTILIQFAKTTFLFLSVIFCAVNSPLSAQEYLWIDQSIKLNLEDDYYSYGTRCAVANETFVFGGQFSSSIQLGDYAIVDNESSPYDWPYHGDIVVFGTNEEGVLEWLHHFGSDKYTGDNLNEIVTDQSGNTYILANISGPKNKFKWDGLATPIDSNNLIIKLDANGEVLWLKGLDFIPRSLRIDSLNNLFVIGNFSQTSINVGEYFVEVDSDGGASGNTIVVKYDENLNPIWYNTAGAVGYTYNASVKSHDLIVNESGKVVVTGNYSNYTGRSNNFQFDEITFTTDEKNGFIAFLDENGKFTKVIQKLNTPSIKYLKQNQGLITFIFYGEGPYSNDFGTFTGISNMNNAAILVFDLETLETKFLKYLHSTDKLEITDVETNKNNLIAIAGAFNGSLYTNEGTGLSTSNNQAFVFRFNLDTDLASATKHGLSDWGSTINIALNTKNDNVAITGRVDGTKAFLNEIVTSTGREGSDIIYGLYKPEEITLGNEQNKINKKNFFYTDGVIYNYENHHITELDIYDLSARNIYKTANFEQQEKNISFLKSGIYILKVTCDGKDHTSLIHVK